MAKLIVRQDQVQSHYLSFEEEEEFASFLIQTTKIGYLHAEKQVLALVQRIVEGKGIETTLSNG